MRGIIDIFRKNRDALFFLENTCVKYDPMQLFLNKQDSCLVSFVQEQGMVAQDSRLSISEEQEIVVEAPLNSSEQLETAINEPQSRTLEEQGVVIEVQPSLSKKNNFSLRGWFGLFAKPKENPAQHELVSLNSPVEGEGSQSSLSKQQETVELEKQEAAIHSLRPNTPDSEEQEVEDSQSDAPGNNTVRSLLREKFFLYSNPRQIDKRKELEIKPEAGSSGEGSSMETASSSKAMTRP